MGNTIAKLKGAIKPPIQRVVRRVFRMDPGYQFKPARCIKEQTIRFEFRGHPVTMVSDHATPLYDTIGEVADYDCYQLSEIDFSRSRNALVLDVGGHIGTASVLLSKLHSGRILTFEPSPQNASWLERNLQLNGASQVTVINAALGDHDGEMEFSIDPDSSVAGHTSGIMAADPKAFSKTLRVKSVTLRTILAQHPDVEIHLIKADCEGGEYGLVNQLTPDILSRVRHLTFEVHDLDGSRNLRWLTQKLEQLGFRLRYKPELHERFGLHHLLASR